MSPALAGGFLATGPPRKSHVTFCCPLSLSLCKFPLVKNMVLPVITYGCESWTVKKAEHRRIDASELCCGRSPRDSQKSGESPLDCKEIQPVNPKGNQP